jgi:hypothetical protein
MMLVGLVGCSSCINRLNEERIDDGFWRGVVEKDENGEKYVRISGLTEEGYELAEENPEATVPETIGGYPVKVLSTGYYMSFGKRQNDPAKLGELKRLIVLPCVIIGDKFFGRNKLEIIEFKSTEEYIFQGDTAIEGFYEDENGLRHYNFEGVFIAPVNGTGEYLTYGRVFPKREDNYLIKDNVFCGEIGFIDEIIIPEGVTGVAEYGYLYERRNLSVVRFPTTIPKIKNNNHLDYKKDLTVYVYRDTVIESRAFDESVTIVRYE